MVTPTLGVGDLPVAGASSLVITLAWILSLGGSMLLRRSDVSGLPYALLAVSVFADSLALAYVLTKATARVRRDRGTSSARR
ncbi:hypothetical protein AB0D27_07465 [Streptomyces sp. NPDC048415]|uniref:hypothetical protein n=1 Tax=Streptomyces sp. NPDC048415 TaxID=3154822 RepID=UPI00341B87FC